MLLLRVSRLSPCDLAKDEKKQNARREEESAERNTFGEDVAYNSVVKRCSLDLSNVREEGQSIFEVLQDVR